MLDSSNLSLVIEHKLRFINKEVIKLLVNYTRGKIESMLTRHIPARIFLIQYRLLFWNFIYLFLSFKELQDYKQNTNSIEKNKLLRNVQVTKYIISNTTFIYSSQLHLYKGCLEEIALSLKRCTLFVIVSLNRFFWCTIMSCY